MQLIISGQGKEGRYIGEYHDRIVRQISNISHRLQQFYDILDLKLVQIAKANHCLGASTCAFTWNNGFKFAYSGDTRPTQEFIQIGRGATLLLHEATFDDELHGEAVAKKHSTTSEAIKAGIDMGAQALMLTHFSQRYPKLPVIAKEGHGKQRMKVALAFDMMRMKVGHIGRFEKFIPALRELYKDEGDEEEPVLDVEEVGPEKEQNKTNERKKRKEEGKSKGTGSAPRNSRGGTKGNKQTVLDQSIAPPESVLISSVSPMEIKLPSI